MMQEAVAYAIVAGAALVVLRHYGPASLRARLERCWPGRVTAKSCSACEGCSDKGVQASISVEALRRTARE